MNTQKIDYRNFFYPPGGIMIWILVMVELVTFGAALIALGFISCEDPALYHASRLKLNAAYGTVNTVVLLTSGYFMALAVHRSKQGAFRAAAKNILYALAGGGLFVVIKSVEYAEKLHHGLTVDYNTFFSFYWLLTLFHLIHVLVGMGLLAGMYFSLRKGTSEALVENTETVATFWHMVDLIWLMLFPTLYLIL